MSEQWDGRPENPERDGWHWLLDGNGETVAVYWHADVVGWGLWPYCRAEACAEDNDYLGPCLTPAEVEAEKVAARREGIEAAAAKAKALTDAWRNPQQRHGVAFGEAITASITALLENGR